jgi:hypothetical protein
MNKLFVFQVELLKRKEMNLLSQTPVKGRILACMTAVLFASTSCTVTNNLYVNDPFPLQKSDYVFYGGAGMGLKPKIDSISTTGEVFSSGFKNSYSLVFGTRVGITSLFNLGLNVHLPEIVGGAGASLRPQLSMFPYPAKFNLALAGDIGFVVVDDNPTIFGVDIEIDDPTRGAFHADFSLPLGYQTGRNTKIFITPRYTLNTFYLRRNFESDRSKRFNAQIPVLSMGVRYKQVQFETTALKYKNHYKYMAGIVVFLGKGNPESIAVF